MPSGLRRHAGAYNRALRDFLAYKVCEPTASDSSIDFELRFLFDRHPGTTTNVSFVDGHSESATAQGLYELQWGPKYDIEVGKTTAQLITW